MNTRRRVLLMLRKRINPTRHADAEIVDLAKARIRLTCRTCKRSHEVTQYQGPKGQKKPMGEWALKRMVAWWNSPNGTGAIIDCPYCTKEARDKAYPLEETK